MTRRRAVRARLRRRSIGSEGQATVELALVLPFVILVLLAIIQVGLIVRDQVMLTHAAREAARAAAVTPDDGSVRLAAERSGALDAGRLSVRAAPRGRAGSMVRVELRYTSRTDLPLVGALLPDVGLQADASMQIEE